uniref:SCP domain-containing protein n=1 Tax=Parastrongyloides trichosuri TaxID=131310 RepID=A0A0N4ZIU8_PARTI
MFLISFLATILLATGSFASINDVADPTQCKTSVLSKCLATFDHSLNITILYPWNEASLFQDQVEQYYEVGGTSGLRKVCKAFRELRGCMGTYYASCFNAAYFAGSAGVDITNSYKFVQIFNQLHFVCGGGFSSYINNDNCMTQTWSNNRKSLRDCRLKFEIQALNTPEDACYLGGQMIQCYVSFFNSGCNYQRPDSSWWACEYARGEIFTRYPQCPYSCTYTNYAIGA